MSKVIVISNRLPVTVKTSSSGFSIEPSVGGLASGLQSLIDKKTVNWIGWPGKISCLSEEHQREVISKLNSMSLTPVLLSDLEVKCFYEDYSNGILWPLFHSLLGELPMNFNGFDEYVKVNKKFAEVICGVYREGDMIWVHDLHFMLLPLYVRQALPMAKIGFFLHIPFPPSEIFRILPQKDLILQGLLGSDLIGFHTHNYMRNFCTSVKRVLGVDADHERDIVMYNDRIAKLGVYPMGIDTEKFEKISNDIETIRLAQMYRGKDGCRILLGIDRLDYTKGIPRRLQAFDQLLAKHPEYIGKVRFIQIAVPSRMDVDAYKIYKEKVEALVATIQGKYSTPNWTPIHYIFRAFNVQEVIALYKAADIMLVTPVRDGMNLVAKEYIASKIDNRGVLILSEFAGASQELNEAISINPYNSQLTAEAFHEALCMTEEQQEISMRSLRMQVQNRNIHVWIDTFLKTLAIQPTIINNTLAKVEVDDIKNELISKQLDNIQPIIAPLLVNPESIIKKVDTDKFKDILSKIDPCNSRKIVIGLLILLLLQLFIY